MILRQNYIQFNSITLNSSPPVYTALQQQNSINATSEEATDSFYDDLQSTVNAVPRCLAVIGGWDVDVGKTYGTWGVTIGKYRMEESKKEESIFELLCNKQIVSNEHVEKWRNKRWTWFSPDGSLRI